MLILLGANHRSAPVEVRERLAFPDAELPGALAHLAELDAVEEALLLSTCNRVEVVAWVDGPPQQGFVQLAEFLERGCGVGPAELAQHTYRYVGREAVRHLFEVAAGLDSMIVGEPQILRQVRAAYRRARQAGTTGLVLERLLQQCLGAARRVRQETGIDRTPVSVAAAAVELARRTLGGLAGRGALLLGAGKMSELVARQLVAGGIGRIVVASRTLRTAQEAAARVSGRAVAWDQALAELARVDVVVSATGSRRPILGRPELSAALAGRCGRPLLLIDIAVPRDVDPAVTGLDNVHLVDIDALEGVMDARLGGRAEARSRAGALLASEVESFDGWLGALAITPTIVALREQLHALGRAEQARFRKRLGPLSEQQERLLGELCRALVQKILHRPIVGLRRAVVRREGGHYAELVRELFELGPDVEAGCEEAAGD